MKKNEFSYTNGRALSHASLEKYRVRQIGENKTDSFSKDQLPSHNVKYYSNEVSVPRVNEQKKMENYLKIEEDLRKKIKTLEYEMKKKINEHSSLVKLFKTKNSSELSHLDIYLEMRKFEEEVLIKNEEIRKLNEELNDKNNEIDENLENCRNEIETASQKIGKINEVKAKLEEKIEEKERIYNDERKSKEEKDNLLKEIRRRYEELQRTNEKLEKELLKTLEGKDEMERTYKEKLLNTKEDNRIKMEDNLNEIERFNLKIREQQQTINELFDKIKSMEEVHKQALHDINQELENKNNSLKQKDKKFTDITDRLSVEESAISSLSFELESMREEKKETKKKNEEKIHLLTSQIQEAQKEMKNEQQKYEKLSKQISNLEEKLRESRETIKIITFEREEKENRISKMEFDFTENQRIIEEKEKMIEEIECKLFNAERRASASMERLKELEKESTSTKEFQTMRSKLEIENYKSIGRLTEMIHQIRAINSKTIKPSQSKSKSIKLKTLQSSEEFETITECISNLTKELNALVESYLTTSEEHKESLDNVRELISDIKAILNVYDSYVRDDELKGATREYVECLEGEDFNSKNRTGYLQAILERLISMTAIEFYASEKGINREIGEQIIPNKSKYNIKYFEDSLEKSQPQSKWQSYQSHSQQTQQSEEQFPKVKHQLEIIEEPEMKVIHRVESNKRILGVSESRYRRDKDSLRKMNSKVLTEECEPMPMKRLDYGKENIMARLNREPFEDHNKHFQYSSVEKNGYHINMKSESHAYANLKRLAPPGSNINQTNSIEQKYFR